MKINPNVASGLFEAYRKSNVAKGKPEGTPAASPEKGDKVEISSEAQRMQALRAQLGALPQGERAERIEALRRQVEAGTYKANPQQLAEKLAKSGVLGPLE